MTVTVVTQEDAFRVLRPKWDELFRSNPQNRPFQSWEWNVTWWKHFGSEGNLRLVLVEEAGRLVGIAPLFLARRFRGLPVPHLLFISHKRADYVDFVVRPGFEATFFAQLFAHLRADAASRDWRFIELRNLPEDSTNVPYLLQESARNLPLSRRLPGESCVSIPLKPSYDTFLSGLSKHFRKDVGYYRRSFERTFKSRFRAESSPPAALEALKDLIAVYRERWQEEKGATQFDDERSAAFERDVCSTLAGAGLYQLYVLYADEKPAAGILAYVHNNRCYVELFAHSPAFHKYSAGTVLLAMAIEHAINNGWTEFDLMIGDEPYKFRWNGQAKTNHHLRFFRANGDLKRVAAIDWIYQQAVRVNLLHRLLAAYKRWKLAQRGRRRGTRPPG